MNSYMNITVRVASAQALAQLRAIQTQAAATGNAGNVAGGALANMVGNRSMSNMAKFGNQLQWTGRQLQYNFTLPILLAGAAATKFALDNERAFVKVVKVYGDVGMSQRQITSETNALRGAFVALSNHFGVQQKEVLDVAAAWAAAGASGLALAKDVKLTMETMILGEMGATDATNALIAIQAQYNQNTDQLTKTIQILNMVENQTGISLEGLVQGMSRAAGTAAGAGIDVRHLAAMLAAMTPAAGSAAQAGNALKTIISRLFAPTKDASAVMKEMGINVASTTWQSKNGSQRMETLADSFVKLNKAQQSAASSIIASRFQINKFGVLMKDIANRNTDAGKSISYYARALESTSNPQAVFNQMQRELNQVLTSNPQRLKQIWTILQNAMADVVQPMIPALLMLAQMLQKAVTWFSQLNPSVQKFVGVGVLMLALFGPLIRYAGSLITLVMELGNTFKILMLPLVSLGGLLGSVGGILGGAFTGALTAIRVVLLGAGAAVGFLGGAFVRLLSPIASVIGAIAGPLMSGFASIVSGTFVWLGATLASTWSAAWGVLGSLTSAGVGLVTSIFTVLPTVLRQSASILWTGLAVIWEAGVAAIGGISSIFVRSTFFMMSTLFTGLPAMFSRGFAVLVGTARFGLFGLLGLITSLPGLILRSGPALIGALASMGRVAVLAFTSPWGAAIAIVVGAIVLFRNQIGQIIQNIIGLFNQLPGGLIGALRSVVQVVQAAAMQVYEWLQYLNPFARHSPSVVDNVTAGMAAINAQVATLAATSGPLQRAGADMQRYGKIVASMKDAQAGRQRVDDRASVGKVNPQALGAFDKLNSDLAGLNGLLATSQAAINAQQRVVDSWSAALDNANAALDAQKAKLDDLQKVQSAANDALSAAKDRLSQWANTPIQGMKAMGDAIFNNSMQQKRLQLQMMKMEDSIGPIDKVRSRIDALNGEMELARGTATALREKGAGSDILKVYDQQIGALNKQKKAITQQLKPYDDLQAALDKLQHAGQELDLENSLKFDPLTRQIEQASNAMKEMPFDVIIKGVRQAQADITRYQAAVDQATAAVNAQQKAVDAAQKARDAISARYDVENKKLDQLKKSYQGVQDAIDGVKGALSDMSGAANDAIQRQQKALDDAAAKKKAHDAALKKAKAAKKKKGPKIPGLSPQMQAFMDAGKAGDFPGVTGTGGLGRQGPAGDQSKMIDQFTKDLAKQTAGMFDGFDIFGPIKDKWNQFMGWLTPKVVAVKNFLGQIFKGVDFMAPFRGVDFGFFTKLKDVVVAVFQTVVDWLGKAWNLLGPDIINFGKQLWAGLQSIWAQVQPELAKFAELFTPAGNSISNVWSFIQPILKALGYGFLGVASILIHVLGSVIQPVFEAIGGILAGFLSIVRGVLRIVIGLFTGDWSMLWKGVVDIFSGAWKIITSLFVGIGKTLWGLVSGLVTGIVNFFKWLYNELVGHSIIPDLIKGIFTWFYKLITLPGWILTYVLTVIFTFIANWWAKSVQPKISSIVNGIHNIFHQLGSLPGWLLNNVWNPLWSIVSNWWARTMSPKITAIRVGIENIFHALGGLPGWLHDHAFQPIYDRLSTVWNKYLRPLGNSMLRGFANIFNNVGVAIAKGLNTGISAINKLIDGLNWIGSHVPGLSFKIGQLGYAQAMYWTPPQFATGGGLPKSRVGAGFKTNGIRAIVGEGNPNHPEFVIPTDPKYRSRAKMLIAQAAKEAGIGFDVGGILSGIGNVAGHVKDTIASTGSTILRKAVETAFTPVYNAAMALTNSIDNRMHIQDFVRAPLNWMKQWASGIENAVPKDVPAGGGPMPSGSGVQRWAPMMLRALAASGLPGSLLPNELRQIETESGGNPNAVQGNIGDINNRTGDLAKGLLQVIGATFRAYHVPGTSNSVFDPWANMMASLNYQKHRYGPSPASIAAVVGHGHGYARGGILGALFDNGGVLRPGLTLAYNGTGKNERVLTSRQEQNLVGGPRTVHFHGDLSFPNVRDGKDAEDFIKNLEILAGGK